MYLKSKKVRGMFMSHRKTNMIWEEGDLENNYSNFCINIKLKVFGQSTFIDFYLQINSNEKSSQWKHTPPPIPHITNGLEHLMAAGGMFQV